MEVAVLDLGEPLFADAGGAETAEQIVIAPRRVLKITLMPPERVVRVEAEEFDRH
jgi:hypothetical protein